MEPQVNRDSLTMTPPDPNVEPVRVVEQTAAAPVVQPVAQEVVAERRVVEQVPVAHAVEHVESFSTVAFHAVAAGLLAVAMLVWGGVAMARAGFDEPLRDPIVDVFGLRGNAISGIIVASLGLLLLIAAVARDRGPIVFLTVVTGIAALIFAFEPTAGDDALGLGTGVPLLIAVGCGVVLLIALAVPTINRHTRSIDRAY
jgi:hypothetical protein